MWFFLLGLGLASYTACAWLWTAPYRSTPSASPPQASPPQAHGRTEPPPAKAQSAARPGPQAAATFVANPRPARAPDDTPRRDKTPALEHTRNFLLAGLDRRPDGSGPALTDTLVVVALDEQSDRVGLISVPRDLYVDIPESGTDRINTVYQVARRSGRDGLELLSRVVADTLELPIEHALALDLGVFERAVDAVGGVDVDVPCPLSDNFVDARAPGGRRLLDVEPGRQRFDGVTAAMYVRSRHGRSDFHRARRQQAVLLGVQQALSGLGVVKLPELLGAFEASVETDMRRYELLSLARRALALSPDRLHGIVIGAEHVEGLRTPEGKSVLLPKREAIRAAVSSLLSAPSPGRPPRQAICAAKGVALGPS